MSVPRRVVGKRFGIFFHMNHFEESRDASDEVKNIAHDYKQEMNPGELEAFDREDGKEASNNTGIIEPKVNMR